MSNCEHDPKKCYVFWCTYCEIHHEICGQCHEVIDACEDK